MFCYMNKIPNQKTIVIYSKHISPHTLNFVVVTDNIVVSSPTFFLPIFS